MKTQYWEPWLLDEESRNQMIGKAFAERIHLVTDLKVADEVAQGLEALYSPDMGLAGLSRKILDYMEDSFAAVNIKRRL